MHEDTTNDLLEATRGGHEFALGALRTGGVLGAFLAFGLGWALLMAPAPPHTSGAGSTYPPAMSDETRDTPGPLWLIDGYNVICANLLGGRDRNGWWREEYRVALLDRLESFSDPGAELWVVFDGASPEVPSPEAAPRRAHTVYAPSADDWLVARVKASADPARVAVVTGDRKVAGRARHGGAEVVEPRALLERCMG